MSDVTRRDQNVHDLDQLSREARKIMETTAWEKKPKQNLDDLGRMSAEAVLTQYEAAAKAFEEMGDAVKDRVAKIAGALLECDRDMKEIAETAELIREKGRHVQIQIEEASALSNDIRTACNEFKRKIGL